MSADPVVDLVDVRLVHIISCLNSASRHHPSNCRLHSGIRMLQSYLLEVYLLRRLQ
jgi:hypothetical protein